MLEGLPPLGIESTKGGVCSGQRHIRGRTRAVWLALIYGKTLMSRNGGLLSAFHPKCDGLNKIEKGYAVHEPVVIGAVFFGICVEEVGLDEKDKIKRPATAQVNGIATVPLSDGPADDWRYHQVVFATPTTTPGAYSFTQAGGANSIKIGYLLDVHPAGKLIRVQLDRSLQF